MFIIQIQAQLSFSGPSFTQAIMGLFSRNKTSKSIQSGERTPSLQSESIKSPQSARMPTSSFGSLPTVAMPKPPDPNVDPAAYLRSIFAVRERTKFITNKAQRNKLNHFDVDMSKWGETAQYVVSIIKVWIVESMWSPDY